MQIENHSSTCVQLSLGTIQSSLWAQGRKVAELLCACVAKTLAKVQVRSFQEARELTPEKVDEADMTAGRLLITVITIALWLVHMIQSRKQTCYRMIGSHHSRASIRINSSCHSKVSRHSEDQYK